VEAGQGAWHRSGRQNDVGALGEHSRVSAVDDGDGAVGFESPGARKDRNLATLEEAIHDFVLAVLAHGEIDRRSFGRDAELRSVLDGATDVCSFEELLGRDASAVQAGSPDLVALDQGHVQPGRRSVEGGGVATGATSDDDYIELLGLVSHGLSFNLVVKPLGES